MRFTPCSCDPGNHRLLPRKWWMRAFASRHRYRCKSCHTDMLLKEVAPAKWWHWAFLGTALVAALGVAYWAVGYFEAVAEASERRAMSRESE